MLRCERQSCRPPKSLRSAQAEQGQDRHDHDDQAHEINDTVHKSPPVEGREIHVLERNGEPAPAVPMAVRELEPEMSVRRMSRTPKERCDASTALLCMLDAAG